MTVRELIDELEKLDEYEQIWLHRYDSEDGTWLECDISIDRMNGEKYWHEEGCYVIL